MEIIRAAVVHSEDSADDTVEQTPTEGEVTEPPRKKSRGTSLNAAKGHLAGIEVKVKELQVLLTATRSMPSSAAHRKKLEGQQAKMDGLLNKLAEAQTKVNAQYTKSVAAQKEKDDKAAKNLEKDEINRKLSDEGAIALVLLRIVTYEHRFLNTTDTADAIWPHIEADFNKQCDEGHLPITDKRSAKALKTRFNLEICEFRLWCSIANRAVHESGCVADDVEDRVSHHRRSTTHTFRLNGYASKAMSVPAYHVNGATAEAGGVDNNLGGASSKGKSSKGKGQRDGSGGGGRHVLTE